MKLPFAGAIDCDLHPAVPDVAALMPYLDDFWREHLSERYIDHAPFVLASYATNLPQSARADWRPKQGVPGADLAALRRDALDAFGSRFAIANVLHGAVALYNADMAAALCKAVNSWIAREWLDREPRLRASILVPPQDIELAVAEIERCAPDQRFVQVLLLVMGDRPL
ncbi:MAG TPA: amidohydrolase family protein, partial [Xanthobacteraceae bacterium]|nr:amidohydrolase family protein [Xanthobacteraceae bacterium]